MLSRTLASLALVLLAACTSSPPPRLTAPDTINPKAQPTVVLGYFTEPEHLGIGSCPESEPGGMIIDCFGPYPSVVLVVQEVLFGSVSAQRIKLSAYDIQKPERFPLGPRHPVLAYPSTWESLNGWHELAKTKEGEWAIRINSDADLPELPCSADRLLQPLALDFRGRGPASQPGITLSAIRKAREDMLKDRINEVCWAGSR